MKSKNHKVFFEFLKREDGSSEFEDFLESLPKKDKEKVLFTLYNIQENGIEIAKKMQWVKKIDNNLFEIRSKVSSNIQRAIYFHKEGNKYVITHGFTKKTQKTPQSEINHAKKLMKYYIGTYLSSKKEEK